MYVNVSIKTFKQVIVEKRAYIPVNNQSVESIFAFTLLSLYYASNISSSDWFIVLFTLLCGKKFNLQNRFSIFLHVRLPISVCRS